MFYSLEELSWWGIGEYRLVSITSLYIEWVQQLVRYMRWPNRMLRTTTPALDDSSWNARVVAETDIRHASIIFGSLMNIINELLDKPCSCYKYQRVSCLIYVSNNFNLAFTVLLLYFVTKAGTWQQRRKTYRHLCLWFMAYIALLFSMAHNYRVKYDRHQSLPSG